MMKPLALLLHDNTMTGSRLAGLFEGLDYRVATLRDPGELTAVARKEMPMLVVADMANRQGDSAAAIAALRADPGTAHVVVIAYAGRDQEDLRQAAARAGAHLATTDVAISQHLPQLLEQALQLD
jgi:CheY-like chemotaxis protein